MNFHEAEKRFHYLEAERRAGRLSDQLYKKAVNQISVRDQEGKTWQLQVYTGEWHVFEAGRWQVARPPAAPVVNQPVKKPIGLYFILAALLLGIVSVFVVFSGLAALLLFGRAQPASTMLTLGDPHIIAVSSVGLQGGKIHIEMDASELDGFEIVVPEGAYLDDTQFTIAEIPILSHSFGESFDPATPLITIDNGQVFAYEPLIITVPIQKTDDEFAMGFYYDRETGELEGIPFVSQNNQEIVLYTAHFSDIVISKIQKGRIVDEIDTGFVPGIDDFQMRNYGSYAAPRGHCAGQSIAAMYYFNHIKNHSELRLTENTPLWGRFDNNAEITGAQKTPDLFWDDSSVIRLSSVLQQYLINRWRPDSLIRIESKEHEVFTYQQYIAFDDELTYYAFAYSMQMTNSPQFVYIAQSEAVVQPGAPRGAHAMIAYKISGNRIYFADPNFEGDSGRYVELERRAGEAPSFKPYNSGLNASDTTLLFDRIGYIGVSSLVDEQVIAHYWNEVFSGALVAQALFPADVTVEVAVDKDQEGQIVFTTLADGLSLSSESAARVDPQGSVFLRLTAPNLADRVYVYIGEEYQGYFRDGALTLTLSEGVNDIGIAHFRIPEDGGDGNNPYRFVNFRRFSVSYGVTDEGIDMPEQVDFNARVLLSGALERMGLPPLSGYVHHCDQGHCRESVHIDVPGCVNEVRHFRLAGDRWDIDVNSSFFPPNFEYFWIVSPEASVYRGFETVYYVFGTQSDQTDFQGNTYELYLMRADISLFVSIYLNTDVPGCNLGQRNLRDLYDLADVVLEEGVAQGMIVLEE